MVSDWLEGRGQGTCPGGWEARADSLGDQDWARESGEGNGETQEQSSQACDGKPQIRAWY